MIHNIAIRFRHWSSRATPGSHASNIFISAYRKVCALTI